MHVVFVQKDSTTAFLLFTFDSQALVPALGLPIQSDTGQWSLPKMSL